jgi:succinyl-CoA synthetase alpha subunit
VAAPVYISFTSKDREIATTIRAALEHRGLDCWIESRDAAPGQSLADALTEAIHAARVMVLVVTANANNSRWMQKELEIANEAKLSVIGVRAEGIVPGPAFQYGIGAQQWIDLPGDAALENLANRIGQIISSRR